LNKALVLSASWGGAFLLGIALRVWGQWHPQPLQAPFSLVLLIVFTPAILLALWMLSLGKGESGQCDQESR
jgi:hypothetical protein